MAKKKNPNHPKKGSLLTVEPIKKLKDIKAIKALLATRPRDLAIFTIGINTNLRASDLVKLKVSDVKGLKAGDELALKEQKTGKLRKITMNEACIKAIKNLLTSRSEEQYIESNDYLVICQDTSLFRSCFPGVTKYIGNFDFGLNADGELIQLFDQTGLMIDSVPYDNVYPWPAAADGSGPTLELTNVNFDNSLGENWRAESLYGTPANENALIISNIVDLQPDSRHYRPCS